ncbi:glycine--tRNA ligase subunit beta [Rehaibacterium terrae]|jgi:glycyl-tRNA synthetase beta chain|uniref:Glycine--tRNA ligase beta subunit n=1 Tax=Rehaibacterium terrae TaxID=1341696 RepID=A0A7W7XXV5_9GAMM|nr:glycine--tRNA ligase subunit beta [Rehaibacterium terrae]MBB5014154.1 glycyl-tRNA synthetase beta chain [Rehaibacterium terrae]
MTDHRPLLIELGTEELPVKALPELARTFAEGVVAGLDRRGLAHGAARALYTPRRLAVHVAGVALQQPEQHSELLGPYLNIALDAEGRPTPALLGFAQKNGIDWTRLARTTDNKGERFVHRATKPGAATAELLPEILAEAIKAMPIPKPMRWGAHEYGFARPVHWLVMLLGDQVVDGSLFGLAANRMSRGHRFHHDKAVWIGSADDYVEALRQAKVLVDPDERRARIRAEVEAAAQAAGGVARIEPGILEEVNGLVEWPKAILCGFEREFLAVPQEALIATMEANQKFFPVLDGDGRLTERFVGVANIESRDEAEVRRGYERVIRPRFADAKFFFDEDRKQGLAAMNAGLKTVTYQQKLGSYADKVARVAALAEAIAPQVGVDAALARRAAELAKADLQSRLVGEFPELQGIAGRYYAAAEGEPAEVAAAIDEAYMPRFAGDAIAPSPLGRVLAVAERLDTLAGGFAAGLKPTGNKDPFALRRNALGLARTLIEGGLDLDLPHELRRAVHANDGTTAMDAAEVRVTELYDFILDRLRGYFADQGVPGAHFEAVAAVRPASLLDFDRRLKAIGEFARLPEAEALAAANKRIRNILKKAGDEIPDHVARSRLIEPAEQALAESVEAAIRETDDVLAAHDYIAVLKRLAWLRAPVDAFFDGVMVMAEDPALRENRLALLKRLADRFSAVAEIGLLSNA